MKKTITKKFTKLWKKGGNDEVTKLYESTSAALKSAITPSAIFILKLQVK